MAIKVFSPAQSMFNHKAIVHESEMMTRAAHPNVVEFFALEKYVIKKSFVYVLAMEMCGSSLHDMVDPPGWPYPDFLQVCRFLCTVTKHLRQMNLVHRDIKPENILVKNLSDGQKIFKLADFGAARVLEPEDRFETVCGTEEFSNPKIHAKLHAEVLEGVDPDAMFGATTELWSIGVTLYVVATGALPFHPKKGRKDPQKMHAMTTQKKTNDIAAEELKTGRIKWSSNLPADALVNAPKSKVQAYLAGLLQQQEEKMWSFERYYAETGKLTDPEPEPKPKPNPKKKLKRQPAKAKENRAPKAGKKPRQNLKYVPKTWWWRQFGNARLQRCSATNVRH